MGSRRTDLLYLDTYTNCPTETKPILLCCENDTKIRRNRLTKPHQMDVIFLPSFINARADAGEVCCKNKKIYIKCGAPGAMNKKCTKLICMDDILNKLKQRPDRKEHELITNELLQKVTMKAYESSGLFTYCPNVKCKGSNGFMLETTEYGIICPFDDCGMTWCPLCKISPYHDRLNCSQAKRLADAKNKDDPNVKYMIENTQLCPKCNYAVTKRDDGCDHMQCVCGTYFCYVCGTLLDKTYKEHVIYDDKYDTYVCPKRLSDVKTGLARQEPEQKHYSDEEYFSDDSYYDGDRDMDIAKSISMIESNMPKDEKKKQHYIAYFTRGDVELEGDRKCVATVQDYINTLKPPEDTDSDVDHLLHPYFSDDYSPNSSDDVSDKLNKLKIEHDSDHYESEEIESDVDLLIETCPIDTHDSEYESEPSPTRRKHKLSKNYYNKRFSN